MELIEDQEFWLSFQNGIIYGITTTSLAVLLGMGAAILFNERFKGREFLLIPIFFPYIVPTVATALTFRWMFNDLFGVFNYLLVILGIIDVPGAWFGSLERAMPSVIMVSVWRFFPLGAMMFLARLQTIPRDWYEAAEMDGASAWHRFRYVTLPQIKEVVFLIFLLRFIWIFNMFDVIWLLTHGGPALLTQHLPIYVFRKAFIEYKAGLGSAAAIFMFLFLAIVFITYSRIRRE